MYNPPIIKPQKYQQGGMVTPIAKTFINRAIDPIPDDPILSPQLIQEDLNSLTEELKKVKSKKSNKKILKNEKESKDYEDVDDFRSWIKSNTTIDKETGEIFFIKPDTQEKVLLEVEPETNVLLYEVFKEQTGRTGEALEAIKNVDLKQLQVSPNQRNLKSAGDELFSKDIQKLRSEGDYKPYDEFKRIEEATIGDRLKGMAIGTGIGVGTAAIGGGPLSKIPVVGKPLAKVASKVPYLKQAAMLGGGIYGGIEGWKYPQDKEVDDERQTKLERGNALRRQAQGLLANDLQNSFLAQSGRISGAQGMEAGNQLREEAALEMERQFYAYRRPGEEEFRLTSTPLNQEELMQMTEQGYQFAPPELAREVAGDQDDALEKAILAGRLPQDVTHSYFEQKYGLTIPEETLTIEEELDNELKRIEIQEARKVLEGGSGGTKFKRFVDAKLPGLYKRGTKNPLKYKLEVHVEPNGDVQYRPSPDIDGVMQDIYNAVQYTQDSEEEISAVRSLLGPGSVGLIPNWQSAAENIWGSLTGIPIDLHPYEKIQRWAKNFTARNITTILGESNRTISDADRKRADDIVSVDSKWKSTATISNALEELLTIFEKPGKNAETAYQALMNAGETYGFADRLFDIEKRLYDKRIASGKNLTAVPQSSRLFLYLASERGEETAAGQEELEIDFELDLTQ